MIISFLLGSGDVCVGVTTMPPREWRKMEKIIKTSHRYITASASQTTGKSGYNSAIERVKKDGKDCQDKSQIYYCQR